MSQTADRGPLIGEHAAHDTFAGGWEPGSWKLSDV